jgi:hypothetical protein
MIYHVGGLTFASNLPFPELPLFTGEKFDCTFQLRDVPTAESWQWSRHDLFPDGRVWLSFARHGESYALRFPGLADFTIDYQTNEIAGHPQPGVAKEVIASLFLDKVIPLYLSRKQLVLHASAVGVASGCIAFLGPSFRGKSTLAAYLESQGCPLLTDDYLLVQERERQLFAVPSYPKLHLREDSARVLGRPPLVVGQHPLHSRRRPVMLHQAEPAPLRRVFVLGPAEEGKGVQLVPLTAREAFMELVQNAYSIDPAGQESLLASFANIGQAAPRLGMIRLSFPRDFALLPEVCRQILDDVDGPSPLRDQSLAIP